MTNNAGDVRPVAVNDHVKWTRNTSEGVRTYTGRVASISPAEAAVELHDTGETRYVMAEDLEPLPVVDGTSFDPRPAPTTIAMERVQALHAAAVRQYESRPRDPI